MALFKHLFSKPKKEKFLFDEHIEIIEENLISADVGIETTTEILNQLTKRKQKFQNYEDMILFIKDYCETILKNVQLKDLTNKAGVKAILFFGINGVGKTTTIAKLAHFYQKKGQTVLLSAADTFRAGAIEQLRIWANSIDVPIVSEKPLSDSGAVVFNSLNMALSKNIDYVLIDTAGRMHTNDDLLRELKKIETIILKKIPEDNLKRVMVIDAQTGQNAFQQIIKFHQLFTIDSLIMTKLDSGAKAGTLIKISKELKIPIEFVGTGEKITDFLLFDSNQYLNELFTDS